MRLSENTIQFVKKTITNNTDVQYYVSIKDKKERGFRNYSDSDLPKTVKKFMDNRTAELFETITPESIQFGKKIGGNINRITFIYRR